MPPLAFVSVANTTGSLPPPKLHGQKRREIYDFSRLANNCIRMQLALAGFSGEELRFAIRDQYILECIAIRCWLTCKMGIKLQ